VTAELQKLADLKASGVLTDEEFAAAKAKLLG
jgi:Short C-terminal domain